MSVRFIPKYSYLLLIFYGISCARIQVEREVRFLIKTE